MEQNRILIKKHGTWMKSMDEEHTRGTRINRLQIIAFMDLFVHIFCCVCNVFKLQVFTSKKTRNMDEEHTRGSRIDLLEIIAFLKSVCWSGLAAATKQRALL